MSGAQAAAADLARMRAPQEQAPPIDEGLLDSARQVFGACETYFKASRTYPPGYPARERFLGVLDDKVRGHLARYGDLEAEITAKGAHIEGQPVFEVERADLNLWYPLYRDGIRELTLGDGMTRDELVQLCQALAELAAMPDDEEGDGEDDAVTLLWDLDLPHLSYVAIDTFVSGAGSDADAQRRLEQIREMVTIGMMKELAHASTAGSSLGRDVTVARRLKSIALGKADLTFLHQENFGALSELPRQLSEASERLFALPDGERAGFAAELHGDEELLDKFLEALIRALMTEGGSGNTEALCARIEQFFTQTVVRGELARATALRRQAVAVLENRGGAPARPELVDAVDQAMSSDAAIAAVVEALATCADDGLAVIYTLVEVLPRRAAPALVRALERVGERVRRRAVCDTIAKWGPRALDAATEVLPASSEDYALDILYLIRKVGTERAVAVLDEATRHASAQVRGTALRLYVEVAPRETAAKRVRQGLRDPESIVRALAVEAVVKLAPAGAGAWLRESIQADAFGKLDGTEKARLFLAYARLGGEQAGPELLERLAQRNLLMSTRIDEERAAAARALAQIGYAPARPLIEKLAKARLARSVLSEACSEALGVLDEAGAAPADKPAEEPSAPIVAPAPVVGAPPPPDLPVISFKPRGPKHG